MVIWTSDRKTITVDLLSPVLFNILKVGTCITSGSLKGSRVLSLAADVLRKNDRTEIVCSLQAELGRMVHGDHIGSTHQAGALSTIHNISIESQEL